MEERIPYSAVLADLEVRKNALNTRISSIDAAIEGIRALLEPPVLSFEAFTMSSPSPVPAFPVRPTQNVLPPFPAAARASAQANPPRTATSRSTDRPAAPAAQLAPERRKKPGLNIYVNKYPEWSRQMSRGNLTFRKKAGLRCPKCGSSDTRESITRGLSDFLMLLFDYSNARCRNCNSRFRVWKQGAAEFAPVQTID